MVACGVLLNNFAAEPSFAADASTVLAVGDGLDPAFNPALDYAYGSSQAVERQADGKMLVGGIFKSLNGNSSSQPESRRHKAEVRFF